VEGEEKTWGHSGRKGGHHHKCNDGTDPSCPGACADGSDATLDGDKSTEPCADGSRPDKSLCVCQDGTQLRTRGNGIKNFFNKVKGFFG